MKKLFIAFMLSAALTSTAMAVSKVGETQIGGVLCVTNEDAQAVLDAAAAGGFPEYNNTIREKKAAGKCLEMNTKVVLTEKGEVTIAKEGIGFRIWQVKVGDKYFWTWEAFKPETQKSIIKGQDV
jgi:hypothetical protein